MARLLVIVGLVVGGVAGWVSLLTTDGAEKVAQTVVIFYPWLALLLPGSLALSVWATLQTQVGGNPNLYHVLGTARLMLLTAAVLGAAGGSFAFWIVATAVTGSVGGEDLNQVRDAILANIPTWQLAGVLVITLATGLIMAQWAHQRAQAG
jgi:hypothetical protein